VKPLEKKLYEIEQKIRRKAGPCSAWVALQKDDGSFKCTHSKHETVILTEAELKDFEASLPAEETPLIMVRQPEYPKPIER